jgi:hypothetical protein
MKYFLYSVFFVFLFAYSLQVLALDVGNYSTLESQVSAEGVGSSGAALTEYSDYRCNSAALYDGLHHWDTDRSFAGPDPGEQGNIGTWNLYCKYQDGEPAYIGSFMVTWNRPPSCTGNEEWSQAAGQCMPPASPSSCEEINKNYDDSTGSCVETCPNGVLNGICLNGAPIGEPNQSDDDSECKPSKDDYSGVFDGKHYCDSNLPEPATCPGDEMAYIQTDDSGAGAFVCGEPVSEPGEAEESETETTETTTDQDGNTVTETTDGDGNTTTTTSDGNGNSSTTNNYPGTDSETGEPCTSESVSCYPTPETQKGLCKDGGSLCDDVRDIRDAIDQESDRTEKTGEFDTEQANTEVSQAETDLETGINSIKSEIGGYFDLALSGGDMVCGPGVDVLGTTIQICPSEMKEELAVIAQIVMLIASLISLMIIFR